MNDAMLQKAWDELVDQVAARLSINDELTGHVKGVKLMYSKSMKPMSKLIVPKSRDPVEFKRVHNIEVIFNEKLFKGKKPLMEHFCMRILQVYAYLKEGFKCSWTGKWYLIRMKECGHVVPPDMAGKTTNHTWREGESFKRMTVV